VNEPILNVTFEVAGADANVPYVPTFIGTLELKLFVVAARIIFVWDSLIILLVVEPLVEANVIFG
jgi:deoxyinosine 3'endonuclease (endonuclease V)